MTAVLATISDAFYFHRDRKNRGSGSGGRRRGWRAVGLMLIAQLVLLTGIVSQAPAQTPGLTLTADKTSANGGDVVTFTATVSNVSGAGTVQLCDPKAPRCVGLGLLGQAQLVSGKAIFRLRPLPGSREYQAVLLAAQHAATPRGGATSNTVTVVTNAATTTTFDTPDGDPGNYSLTAHVTANGPAPGPTGKISFQDTNNNNKEIANANLGTATGGVYVDPTQENPDKNDGGLSAAGDINNDGILDFIMVPGRNDNPPIKAYIGNSDGSFEAAIQSDIDNGGCSKFQYSTLADFNEDGNLDVAFSIYSCGIFMYMGDGHGSFHEQRTQVTPPVSGFSVGEITVADFNEDGHLDIAGTMSAPLGGGTDLGQVYFYMGDGNGGLTPGGNVGTCCGGQVNDGLSSGDYNEDGHIDVAFYNIALGQGDGTFSLYGPRLQDQVNSVFTGDFDGDGHLDLTLGYAGQGGNTIQTSLFRGDGQGNFSGKGQIAGFSPVQGGDFNADGKQDIALAFLTTTYTQSLVYEINRFNGDNWQFDEHDVPLTTYGIGLATGDYNGDGLTDALVGIIDYSSSDFPYPKETTTFLSNYSWTASATATGVSADWAGTHEVLAHYEGDAAYGPSNSNKQPLGKALTSTALSISPASVAADNSATLTATVTADGGQTTVQTGTVDFCVAGSKLCMGSDRIGSAQIFNGVASIVIFADIGQHSYTARFKGSVDYTASPPSDAQTLTVTGKYATVTTLGQPQGSGPYSIPVTVQSFAPPTTPPTGTVDIFDQTNNNVQLGTTSSWSQPTDSLTVRDFTINPGQGPNSLDAPNSLASADFNKDGLADLAIAAETYNDVQIYLGQSNGKFSDEPHSTISVFTDVYPIVAGDFTNDGNIDIAVGTQSQINVYTGDGTGGFSATPFRTAASDMVAFAVSDFDTSGTLDLALVTAGNSQIWLGDGAGRFTAKGSPVAIGNNMKVFGGNAAAGDFNNDANPDLIVPQGPGSQVWVLLGDGTGQFQANPQSIDTGPGATVQSVAVADFDADGKLDFTVGVENYGSDSSVAFYQGQGDGKNFTSRPVVTFANTSLNNFNVTVGDFNADGLSDVAAAYFFAQGDYPGQLSFLLASDRYPWTFTSSKTVQVGKFSMSPVAGDFNGDGFADLAVGNGHDNNVSAEFVQPTVTVTASADVPVPAGDPSSGNHELVGIYSGDALFEKSPQSNSVGLAPQKLDTTLTVTADPQGSSNAGQPVTLTATFGIKNGDAAQGHDPKGELVTFTTQNGNVFLGTAPLALDTNTKQYVATLQNVTHLPSGDITIIASYPGDAYFNSMTGSLPYKVGQPVPVKVALAVEPAQAQVPAGTQVTLTATVNPTVGGTVYFCKVAAPCTDI
ncbi:FG-GAP-like repeat-containing protein, partial [Phyllobacterium leguminum]